MKGAADLFRFLIDCAERGERTALVTITDVIGSSSRAAGTHMAVSETGVWKGSLSGGCVEAAVVAEAKRIIDAGRAELVRFGAGSRYIDIRLPCGGGLDLLIVPQPSIGVLLAAEALLASRRPAGLIISADGGLQLGAAMMSGWADGRFAVWHEPDLRLWVVGHGAETEAMARLGLTFGAQVHVLTPDRAVMCAVQAAGAEVHLLTSQGECAVLAADAYSAVVFLFHDHDWEPTLISQALASDAFYVGAMGSRATHTARLDELARLGVSQEQSDRLRGPIGLIPSSRDPDTLALSVLSEIVAVKRSLAAKPAITELVS